MEFRFPAVASQAENRAESASHRWFINSERILPPDPRSPAMSRNLKRLLAEKKRVHVFHLGHLCDPKIIDLVGVMGGWDAIWLDQEHAGLTLDMISQCARAARAADLDCFVRLTATDYATMMRPLEVGASGIMAAQIRTAAEAAKVIEWAKFWPQGLRGVNSGGVDGGYGTMSLADYMRHANESTYVIIQIEHFEAVENVEAIAALPNLDALFVGPADLSQSMGLPGETDHPKVMAAVEQSRGGVPGRRMSRGRSCRRTRRWRSARSSWGARCCRWAGTTWQLGAGWLQAASRTSGSGYGANAAGRIVGEVEQWRKRNP